MDPDPTYTIYDQEWMALQCLRDASTAAEDFPLLTSWRNNISPFQSQRELELPSLLNWTDLGFLINGVKEYRCYLALAWLASPLSAATQNVLFFYVPKCSSADAESPAKKVDDYSRDW